VTFRSPGLCFPPQPNIHNARTTTPRFRITTERYQGRRAFGLPREALRPGLCALNCLRALECAGTLAAINAFTEE
jgi:hypothetical protein